LTTKNKFTVQCNESEIAPT